MPFPFSSNTYFALISVHQLKKEPNYPILMLPDSPYVGLEHRTICSGETRRTVSAEYVLPLGH